jgi:hypothetical protein
MQLLIGGIIFALIMFFLFAEHGSDHWSETSGDNTDTAIGSVIWIVVLLIIFAGIFKL